MFEEKHHKYLIPMNHEEQNKLTYSDFHV